MELKAICIILLFLSSKPLTAEYHTVLAQSYEELPYVSHMFSDPQNNIWALVNPYKPLWCTDRNRTYEEPEEVPEISTRIVKILKYNVKGNK